MPEDRRCSDRLDYAINVTYKFEDGSTYKVAQSVNINDNGMSLHVPRVIPINNQINFMIEGYHEIFKAKVVWCKREPVIIGEKEKYQVGITYEEGIAERVNEILKEIIGDKFGHGSLN